MKICPNCGYRDNQLWCNSRFDFNAEYMRFEEAIGVPELKEICEQLKDKSSSEPIEEGLYIYYRRGTGGVFLYRVLKEDFRVPRERKKHIKGILSRKLSEAFG